MIAGRIAREPWPGFDTLAWADDALAQAVVAEHPDGMTLEEVGDLMGLTRERIRQIELTALRKLRKAEAAGDVPTVPGAVVRFGQRGVRRASKGAGSVGWSSRFQKWRVQRCGKHIGYFTSIIDAQAALERHRAMESAS